MAEDFENSKQSIKLAQKRIKDRNLRLKPGTYSSYIIYCDSKSKQDEFQKQIKEGKKNQGFLEKHHIVPRYNGGSNDQSNLILLPPRTHILGHLLLYLEFGRKEDLTAYIFRKSTQHVNLKSHGKKMAYLNKNLGNGIWNIDVQSIL